MSTHVALIFVPISMSNVHQAIVGGEPPVGSDEFAAPYFEVLSARGRTKRGKHTSNRYNRSVATSSRLTRMMHLPIMSTLALCANNAISL